MGEYCAEFVEDRVAKSGWYSADAAFDHTACTVLIFHALFQIFACLSCCLRVWHIEGVVVDFFRVKGINLYRADGFGVGAEGNVQFAENFGGNGSGCDSSDGFASGGASAASVIAESVFLVEGVVCVAWTVGVGDVSVVSGTLVCVSDYE